MDVVGVDGDILTLALGWTLWIEPDAGRASDGEADYAYTQMMSMVICRFEYLDP